MSTQSPVNHSGEKFVQHWQGCAVIFFGILAVFPEAIDINYISAIWDDDKVVEKSPLFAECVFRGIVISDSGRS
jgi:hypothetical protein